MIDYNKKKGKQLQEEIRELTVLVRTDIENADISKREILDRISFHEEKYEGFKVLLLDPSICPDLIHYKDEILKLKDQLRKSI
ncbi:hypothetical protein PM10SUCC1_21490 [Propionigenium maris DSM 9537]|uniref:Uncharacterized protein n=1 Tax=Propionigenium maris DSM 9537 TaxID=1123000 RepID=A0A9W6GM22_9FUSO|nr:hypothetical protein [Propionigenium maris]GLI56635.1 hypothetical protein PM10SUCC1_21490 [Propionigenium maris DSM 9537]